MNRLRYLAALTRWHWFMLCDLTNSLRRTSRCRLYVEAAMKGADDRTLEVLRERAFKELEDKPVRPKYSDFQK